MRCVRLFLFITLPPKHNAEHSETQKFPLPRPSCLPSRAALSPFAVAAPHHHKSTTRKARKHKNSPFRTSVPSESCRPFPPQNHALPQRDMGQKQNSSTDDVMESKSKDLDSKSQSILREGMDYSCQECEIFTFACQNKILTLLFMLPYHPPYSS